MKRDPWKWVVLLGVAPLVLKLLGCPVGEPVAEDFDFLRRALLTEGRSLLDGGGSLSFWRPISHQLYYLVMGPLILSAPRVVAALHVALLALGGLLLYRALRPSWSGWAAAAAATFPMLAESTRTIVAWPTQFVDLGVFLFSALALHERSRRRLWTALAALLAALLCKEVAIVTGVMLAWWPDAGASRRERWTWAVATAALVAAWASLYVWVRAHAGLTLPHQLETDPAVRHVPWMLRVWWGKWNSLRAVMSLALAKGRWDLAAGAVAAALLAGAAAVLARTRAARGRFAQAAPWVVWGAVWFGLASATLAAIYPWWQPNRAQFGSVGLGIAAVALLEAAGPWWVGALVALRTALLLLAPTPAALIEREAPDRGAFMDFERLTRLQRLMHGVRTTLHAAYPTLPRGATLVTHNLPLSAQYAFGGSLSLEVWYRDTTLQWTKFSDFSAGRTVPPVAIVEFESRAPQITLVPRATMEALLDAIELAGERRYEEVLTKLDQVERMPMDPHSQAFLASVSGTRGNVLAAMGRIAEAEVAARRAVQLYPRNSDGHFALAMIEYSRGRLAEAEAHFDTVLMERQAGDSIAVILREQVRAARRAGH